MSLAFVRLLCRIFSLFLLISGASKLSSIIYLSLYFFPMPQKLYHFKRAKTEKNLVPDHRAALAELL
jgi:hypothetical protein